MEYQYLFKAVINEFDNFIYWCEDCGCVMTTADEIFCGQ